MNHIHEQNAEITELTRLLKAYQELLADIDDYARLPKFDSTSCGEKFINPQDIMLRIAQGKQAIRNLDNDVSTPCKNPKCFNGTFLISGYCSTCYYPKHS